jgi:Domain of unknown function (DUF4136)
VIGCRDRRRRRAAGAILAALVAAGPACYPGRIMDVAQLDVVAALHGDTVDFGALRTFAMPDTVVHLTEQLGAADIPVSRAFDALILSEVASNFEARGYVRELAPAQHRPDFIVLVAVTASVQVDAWVSYPWFAWWGFYPGWAFFPGFTPAWGINYPWSGVVSAFAWTQGTLIVDMIDLRNIDPQRREIHSLWAGALNGVIDAASGVPPEQRLTSGINQMFELSPYLRAQ